MSSASNVRQINGRQHRRIDAPATLSSDKRYRIVNLSESGMLLSAMSQQFELSTGKRSSIELNLDNMIIEVQFEVVRKEENNSVFERDTRLGVRFVDLKAGQLVELREYLKARS